MAGKYRNSILLTLVLLALLITTFIFFPHPTSETIISDQMSEFIDVIDRTNTKNNHKLIVFDIDDTILASSEILGTPTWFYHMVNLLRQKGAAKFEAYKIMQEIDRVVQEHATIIPIEQTTISAIHNWRSLGAHVIAIASRSPSSASVTTKQLDTLNLKFSSSYFSCIENKWHSSKGAFINGIIYVDFHNDRREIFMHFLELASRCNLDIEFIAHADDQVRHVADIAACAKDARKNFVGIIYGKALSSREFHLADANKQLRALEDDLGHAIIPEQYRKIFEDVF
jgi:hypothetical protein